MRKGKRFTPNWIRNAIVELRGTGTGRDYIPWHQIRRSDPSSQGRSHEIPNDQGRLFELLSDMEKTYLVFATMIPGVVDIRDQFPLSREFHQIELAAYHAPLTGKMSSGTLELARELGIKHPVLVKEGDREHWIMSTDLLLTIKRPQDNLELLAISVKYPGDLTHDRSKALLTLEREYWRRQGVTWLLMTPEQYDPLVAINAVMAFPWANVQPPVPSFQLNQVDRLVPELEGLPISLALNVIADHLCINFNSAQFVFWRAVWTGIVPLNLRRHRLITDEISLLSPSAFLAQNPIYQRNSSWPL